MLDKVFTRKKFSSIMYFIGFQPERHQAIAVSTLGWLINSYLDRHMGKNITRYAYFLRFSELGVTDCTQPVVAASEEIHITFAGNERSGGLRYGSGNVR